MKGNDEKNIEKELAKKVIVEWAGMKHTEYKSRAETRALPETMLLAYDFHYFLQELLESFTSFIEFVISEANAKTPEQEKKFLDYLFNEDEE